MATETVNQHCYGLNGDDNNMLSMLATQLAALLLHTYGESGEAFRCMNDKSQDAYMWACADVAEKIEKLTEKTVLIRA